MSTIPTCYKCGGSERPFNVKVRGNRAYHDPEHCNAPICPSCGQAPQADDAFCAACRALDGQITHIRTEDVIRIGEPLGTLTIGRVPRGRHGR